MAKAKYGAAHRKARAAWAEIVDEGGASCCLCGKRILPGQPWDLDHKPGTTDEYRGPACTTCNRRDGAVRRNNARKQVGHGVTSLRW